MKLIALLLCAALLAVPLNHTNAVPTTPPKESEIHMAVILIIGGAITVGGWVVYKVAGCRPKYYCVRDADGNQFPSNASRTERALNEWEVVSGPYSSAAAAAAGCAAGTPQAPPIIPSVTMKVQRSRDLVSWELAATIQDDPDHFTWSETNSASVPAMFYRVR